MNRIFMLLASWAAGCVLVTTPPLMAQTMKPVGVESYLRYDRYFEDSAFGEGRDFVEYDVLALLGGNFGHRWQYKLVPRIRFDNARRAGHGVEFLEDDDRRPMLTADEAFISCYSDLFEVSIGKQFYSWGVADGYKPTDNLNPRDMLDVPRSEKIGVPSVSFYRYGSLLSVQFVAVPAFTPGRLAGNDNRWFFDIGENLDDLVQVPGMGPVINNQGSLLPARTARNAQAGIQLSSSTLLEGWDLAVVYFHGNDPLGVLEIIPDPPVLKAGRVFPGFEEIGASVSTVFADWEVHAEVAFHQTRDHQMDDDYVEYIAGWNYTIYEPGDLPFDDIIITMEYAGEHIVRERYGDSRFYDLYIRSLTGSLLARVILKFSEDTSLEISGVLNLEEEDYWSQAILNHKLSDNLKLEVSLDIIGGSTGTFFGSWEGNDRLGISAAYYF